MRPEHYTKSGKREAVVWLKSKLPYDQFMAALYFNVIKYISRLGGKDTKEKDLKKVRQYLIWMAYDDLNFFDTDTIKNEYTNNKRPAPVDVDSVSFVWMTNEDKIGKLVSVVSELMTEKYWVLNWEDRISLFKDCIYCIDLMLGIGFERPIIAAGPIKPTFEQLRVYEELIRKEEERQKRIKKET